MEKGLGRKKTTKLKRAGEGKITNEGTFTRVHHFGSLEKKCNFIKLQKCYLAQVNFLMRNNILKKCLKLFYFFKLKFFPKCFIFKRNCVTNFRWSETASIERSGFKSNQKKLDFRNIQISHL